MINLTLLSNRELAVLAENHANRASTDSKTYAYLLELAKRVRTVPTFKDGQQGTQHRIEGA